jgi:hypothetical protein
MINFLICEGIFSSEILDCGNTTDITISEAGALLPITYYPTLFKVLK